jgi:hypothetical protein
MQLKSARVLCFPALLSCQVVLRHVLGVALAEVLFLSKGDADPVPVSLASRPQQLLNVLARRNELDRQLHDAATVSLTMRPPHREAPTCGGQPSVLHC